MRNIVGIVIAMVGVIAYTEVRRKQVNNSNVLPTAISVPRIGGDNLREKD